MRTKLLSAILLASTALAGVASADPIVRDHRDQPTMNHYQSRARFINKTVARRPSWMPRYTASSGAYGYQVDADGDEVIPYQQGQDPYVEGIARGEWISLAGSVRLAYNRDSKIDINLGGERLRSLEFQATGGRNFIREVHVQLNDGRELELTPNRMVDVVHSPNMRLDLGAGASCGIRNIEVFGYSSGKGTFNVIGA